MRLFLITIGLGLSVCSSLIYWADVGHQWHRLVPYANRALHPGEVWLYPNREAGQMEMRLIRTEELRSIARPDVVWMGNSRSNKVDGASFDPGKIFFNCFVNGAVWEDHVAYWQELKELGKLPHRVVIQIDPWNFNSGYWSEFWYANRDYVERFGARREDLSDRLQTLQVDLRELFSLNALRASVRYAVKGKRSDQLARAAIVRESELPPGRWGFRANGSVCQSLTSGTARVDRQAPVQLFGGPEGIDLLADWQIDQHRLQLANQLVKDMVQHAVVPVIVLVPFHPTTWALFKQRPEYALAIRDYYAVLRQLKDSNPQLLMCGSLDPKVVGCDDVEFVDWDHPDYSCVQKLVKRCGPALGV